MEDNVVNLLIDKNRSSGGHCGTYLADIMNKLNLPFQDVKEIANNLYKKKIITIREGSQGKLIFYKK